MKLSRLMPAMASAILSLGSAQAALLSIDATADDWLRNTDSSFTSFETSGNPTDGFLRTFGASGNFTRSALEFSLSGISAATAINSATFVIQSRGSSVAGGTFNFWGYSGDGVITDLDGVQTTTLLATAPTQSGQPQYTVDVTSLIQLLVTGGASFAGILITVSPEGDFFGSDFVSSEVSDSGFPASDAPRLTVDFTAPLTVPEPGTPALVVAAALAAFALRRRSR